MITLNGCTVRPGENLISDDMSTVAVILSFAAGALVAAMLMFLFARSDIERGDSRGFIARHPDLPRGAAERDAARGAYGTDHPSRAWGTKWAGGR